jgi:hypothetical protein
MGRKLLFWLIVSESIVCGQLAPFFKACDEQNTMTGVYGEAKLLTSW